LRAEVVQIDKNEALVAPFGATLLLGARMYRRGPPSIAPTTNWIGRVINAFGEPIDRPVELKPRRR
jgi:flagellum-specific ATP synthase